MANLFDIYKEFRRGNTILSKEFNDLQYSLVGSFKKLGTERVDSETGVEETFSVGEPTKPVNAATKGYVDQQIIDNVAVDGATGPRGPQGEVGPQGMNLVLTGTVPTASDLNSVDATQGQVYVANDTDIAYVYDNGSWVNIGKFGGPQGPKGTPGINGSNGARGPQGYPGTNGKNGSTGSTGSKGSKGDTGPAGPAGASYNGPTIERGAEGEFLSWSSYAWRATDQISIYSNGQFKVKSLGARADNTFVMSNPDGILYPYVAARGLNETSDIVDQLSVKVKELTERLAKLEKKV